MRRSIVTAACIAVVVVSVGSGCADDGDDEGGSEAADVSSEAAGSGGVLVLNGAEIPLVRATCLLGDDTFEASAVSGDGLQVFAVQDNPLNPVSTQIRDADQVEWSPDGVQGDEAVRDGTTVTSESYTYVNDRNDLTIEVSFTIECP